MLLLAKNWQKFLVILFISIEFFYLQAPRIWRVNYAMAANSGDAVINELAWMGTEVSSSDEWIELKNLTDVDINLEGWIISAQDGTPNINLTGSIPARGYFLLERVDDESVSGVAADLIYTGALENSGEVLELRDSQDVLIDTVDASGGWPAGDNDNKLTMERGNDGGWQSGANSGGTPKDENSASGQEEQQGAECGNGILEEEEGCDDGNVVSGDGCSAVCGAEYLPSIPSPSEGEWSLDGAANYNLGDVVINEFVSDPADGEVEWVELYNITSNNIDLDGWTIEEGSGSKTKLEGNIGNSKFIIIEKPKGNLNNKGDIIILRDKLDNLIDSVAYGDWEDGQIGNNTPLASDPNSVARKFDGQNSYNNFNDFAVTITPTKGESNIIQEVGKGLEGEENNYDYSSDIIISEIFPNPFGSDANDEFIELFNKGNRDVNLSGWKLGDNSKRKYSIANLSEFRASEASAIIKAGAYLAIHRSESKVALNNGGDSVKLYQPLKDNPLRVVKYERALENWSYNTQITTNLKQIAANSEWVWSEVVTPGEENVIKTINHPPLVDFDAPVKVFVGVPVVFDSSDTVDEDNDALKYSWDFGDGIKNNLPGPQHTFLRVGVYVVKLVVSDGEDEKEKEEIVRVVSAASPLNKNKAQKNNQSEVIINEILPNPEGNDADGEWIELYNMSEQEVNLLNWQLDDSEEGSRPYNIANLSEFRANEANAVIKAGEYLMIDRTESNIALNNTGDAARLFNDLDELVDEVEYGAVVEGESYARGANGGWFWTTVLTPAEENVIRVSDSALSLNSKNIKTLKQANKKQREFAITTLEKVKEFEVGDLVKVSGTVAVLPGILGLQYFYIVGSAGIQVYNYKKEFPKLKVGDYVEVSGELSISNGESRLKIKQSEDIKIIEHAQEPVAEEITNDKITEDSLGQLVSITGEVVERKSSVVYLDDGADEIRVYIKKSTGINAKSIKEGDVITVIGLVGRTKAGLRVMPRSQDDIIRRDVESGADNAGRVLGEVAVSDEWEIAKRDKKMELFKYLLVIAAAVIVVLVGLLVKLEVIKK